MTAKDLYAESVQALSTAERFRLVALILDELARSGAMSAVVDGADAWSERDQQDLTAFSLSYGAALYPEDEELI